MDRPCLVHTFYTMLSYRQVVQYFPVPDSPILVSLAVHALRLQLLHPPTHSHIMRWLQRHNHHDTSHLWWLSTSSWLLAQNCSLFVSVALVWLFTIAICWGGLNVIDIHGEATYTASFLSVPSYTFFYHLIHSAARNGLSMAWEWFSAAITSPSPYFCDALVPKHIQGQLKNLSPNFQPPQNKVT